MAQGAPTKIKKRKKSVLKRAAQSITRAARNRSMRTRVRTTMKTLRAALNARDKGATEKLLAPTISSIDRAVSKGILTKNAANRYKSRLSLACNELKVAKA